MMIVNTRSKDMKGIGRTLKALLLTAALAALSGLFTAQAAENKAQVRAVRGTAQYSTDMGKSWKSLRVGTSLGQKTMIKTASASVVDLFLNQNGPVLRVTEDSTMTLDKLTFDGVGVETVIETQLDLKNGRIQGNVKKLAEASKYEVKTPVGVAGIRGTQFDISSTGEVTVTEGSVVVVFIVDGVAQAPTTVVAGETVSPPPANGMPPVRVATPPGTRADVVTSIKTSSSNVGVTVDGNTGSVNVIITPQTPTPPPGGAPPATPPPTTQAPPRDPVVNTQNQP